MHGRHKRCTADIMTSAKALMRGVPVGAFVLNEKAAKLLVAKIMVHHGGNPFERCALAQKVFVDTMRNDKITENMYSSKMTHI